MFEIFSSLPEGLTVQEIPSMAAEIGSQRLAEAEKILGKENLSRAVKRVGPYLLEEELTEKLRMRGLTLPPDGECKSLTAQRWPGEIPSEKLAGEVLGLLLNAKDQKTFQSVTKHSLGFKTTSEALEFCRHLFFEQNLKVVVQYTAPRFHHC
jgi:hypothetical protein